MQKEVFMGGEGDGWFRRNRAAITRPVHADDPVLVALGRIRKAGPVSSVLEVGCGAGQRGAAIATRLGVRVCGIDPSAEAVAHACSLGIDARRATAEALPFADATFDVVLFGFCLYLCDRGDLFRIATEADRVLRPQGWVAIHDFFSPQPSARPYHHRAGLWTFKMDYRRLFEWHPHYTCMHHEVHHHATALLTDAVDEWVAVSVLRKMHVDAD